MWQQIALPHRWHYGTLRSGSKSATLLHADANGLAVHRFIMPRFLSDEYVQSLPSMPFWQAMLRDRELFPEIRNNAVTVYYRGAALIRDIRLKNGNFIGKTHVRYIPLRSTDSVAVEFISSTLNGLNFSNAIEPWPLANADQDVLAAYKQRMKLIGGAERNVIDSLCRHSGNVIVDQEMKFQTRGDQKPDKIDILAYSAVDSTYCFVEVKSVTDSRLAMGSDGVREVVAQLRRYCDRIRAHAEDISQDIESTIKFKTSLGLGDRVAACHGVAATRILAKPILAIGGCSDRDVRSILQRDGVWESMIDSLNEVAAGLILCGQGGTRLDLADGRQRRWFDRGLLKLPGNSPA